MKKPPIENSPKKVQKNFPGGFFPDTNKKIRQKK